MFNAIKTTALFQGVLTLITEQSFLDKRIRVFGTPEDPLFLARDVAEWIDYSKRPDGSYKMDVFLKNVDDEEKIKILNPAHNLGGCLRPNQEYWFLTEDGLYEVLMQSRKPKAKEFKKEVKKILKSIRKTGGYVVGQENMMQHRTYERHRSCMFFFWFDRPRGCFQPYRMNALYKKKLDSKKRAEKF